MHLYPNTSIPWPQFPDHFARVNNCCSVLTQGLNQWRNAIRAFISHHRGSWLPAGTSALIPCADAHILPHLPLLRLERLGRNRTVACEQMLILHFFESYPTEVRGQKILFQGAESVVFTPLTPNFRGCECLSRLFPEEI